MSLETTVQDFTEKTEELLTAVNLRKVELDAAKNAAASSAQGAFNSAATATTKAAEAATSASGAAASKTSSDLSRDAAATSAEQAGASAVAAAASAVAASDFETGAGENAAAASAAAADAATAKSGSEAARNASVAAKTASEAARDAAVTAKTAAETAETNAETAEAAAEAAQAAAETARTVAQTSATQASASKDAAALSATAAATSASDADTDRIAAQAARTGSEAARDAALASQTAAETARTAAQTAQAGAQTARTGAETAQTGAQTARTGAELAQTAAAASLAFASFQASTATAQASLAAGYAASASSVVQQDLSGITAQALHRSPNAITAMTIYDTSKDSDGGAWTEKCQHTSWWNEPLMGKWLGAQTSEADARLYAANVGSELIVNGGGDTTTGWSTTNATMSVVDGNFRVSGLTSGYPSIWQAFSTVVGKLYRVVFKQKTKSGVSWAVNKTDTNSMVSGNRVQFQSNNSAVTVVGSFVATATTTYIHFGMDSAVNFAGHYADYDDISVREIISSGSSGDYYQAPSDGKFYRLWKNILTQTDLLSHSNWAKVGGVTVEYGFPAPDGTNTAWKVVFPNGGGTSQFYQVLTANFPVTQSVWLRADSTVNCDFGFYDSAFDASTVTVTSTWQQFTRTRSAGLVTADRRAIWMYSANANTTVYLWRPQLEAGATATTYEAKTTIGSISETFRGNKADFPRLAALVCEGANLNIYDLTEPGRPMWMRFIGSSVSDMLSDGSAQPNGGSSVAMLNGVMTYASAGVRGPLRVNFITERAHRNFIYLNSYSGTYQGSIAERHAGKKFDNNGDGVVAHWVVNAVAMTALPNAPVDPATGLRIPTIAVMTNDGVSVFRHDGTVVRSLSTGEHTGLAILGTRLFFVKSGAGDPLYQADLMTIGANFGSSVMNYLSHSVFPRFLTTSGRELIVRTDRAPWQVSRILTSIPASMTSVRAEANIRSTHNTGWMPADIRRAYLSDTTVDAISGPELVTNGTFDTNDLSIWSTETTRLVVDGKLRVYHDTLYASVTASIPVTVGRTYRVKINRIGNGGTGTAGYLYFGFPGNVTAYSGTFNSTATAFDFTATNSTFIMGLNPNGTVGGYYDYDDFSVREVVYDRSYKAATANINGTITRSQLASGTSLVGYSGFSAANYLREPYSSDLDFGTGEWSCSAWVNTLYSRRNQLVYTQQLDNGFYVKDGATVTADATTAPNGTLTADKVVITNRLYFFDNTGVVGTKIFSIYAKAEAGTIFSFSLAGGHNVGGSNAISVDLATATVTSGQSPSLVTITDAGSGWYRIAAVVTTLAASGNGTYYSLSATTGLYLWGVQLEAGNVLTDYQPVVSGSEIVSPIFDRGFSSGTRIRLAMNGLGNLIAEAFDGTTTRTVTTSAAYNIAQWFKAEASYTVDGTLSIRVNGKEMATTRGNRLLSVSAVRNMTRFSNSVGASTGTTTNAATGEIFETSDNGLHIFDIGNISTLQYAEMAGGVYNTQFKTKANGRNLCSFIHYPSLVGITLDYNTGVATVYGGGSGVSNISCVLQPDGFYLVSFSSVAVGTDNSFRGYLNAVASYVGDPTKGVIVKNCQIALGSSPSTYVETNGTPVQVNPTPLTIGNNYVADAPFPGSIALLKLSATVPTAEQSQFMYEQEKQLFRPGAQAVLPDSGAIVDMAYDDATDRWVSVSAANESYWTGLVRNSVTPVPAGSYTRIAATSGVELVARGTTSPGVDVTIPPAGLREELVKRAEAAARLSRELTMFDYVGGFTANTTNGSTAITNVSTITYPASYIGARISGSGIPANTTIVAVSGTTIYLSAAATATATAVSISFLDFELPVGFETKAVLAANAPKQEGATKDYTRLYDGFIETVRFAVAPGATAWVQIQAQRTTI